MRPFLRWAGGKRWLAVDHAMRFPEMKRYVEPFLGGGAVFFAQRAQRAFLSDLNTYLINAYEWMKRDYKTLYSLIIGHFDQHTASYYYQTRSNLGYNGIADAAAFIYLNRSCFNGLFRVNLSGKFNVPIGSKLFEIRDLSEFASWSKMLANADITVSDFEDVIDGCGEGDFMFIDPPYTVSHNENGFIEYNEKIFSWDDQVRLASCLARAGGRGANFLLTNADHESVRALYAKSYTLVSRERGSEMAGSTAYRGKTTELLVLSSPNLIRPERLL